MVTNTRPATGRAVPPAARVNKLRQWRTSQELSVDALAAMVPCTRQTWYAWERFATIPPEAMMRRIVEITAGAVQPNDFYDLPALGGHDRQVAA